MWNRGLVIGKFYPPHAGHKFLIDSALSQVKQLTVLICKVEGERPPAQLRAEWLREIHPAANVRVIHDIGHDDDSQVWADYTRTLLGFTPDVVFTSEDYGVTYTECLRCDHVMLDRERQTIPCAGRLIRANPFQHFEYLEPSVKAYYALRIAIVGAESTGTTTLSQALAEAYGTTWVPEYGRLYSEAKVTGSNIWSTQEFIHIAQAQNAMEDQLARTADRVLFCDTNALATAVWHERYMGHWSNAVEAISNDRRYDLYLLTDVDIPFVQDGMRDGEHIRVWMHEAFMRVLKDRGIPYLLVSGSREQRLTSAKTAIDELFGRSNRTA